MDLFGEPEEPKVEEAEVAPAPAVSAPLERVHVEAEPGLVEPRAMQFCLGHEAVERRLLTWFRSGKLPHGLVFSGPQGVGKATMAFRFARFLLKHGGGDPNQDSLFGGDAPAEFEGLGVSAGDPVSSQVASGGHPDLFTAERGFDSTGSKRKNSLDVAEIRKIAPFLRMTASQGGWRVVVVDDADMMNRNAQNAILKVLEEPPKRTMIILVTHRLGALIPTIRSRTQVVGFEALAPEVMHEILAYGDHGMSREALDKVVALSGGSVSRALEYVSAGAPEMLAQILDLYRNAPGYNWPEIHHLADQMGRAGPGNSFEIFERLVQWVFVQMAKARARGRAMPPVLAGVEECSRHLSLDHVLKICDKLAEHFAKTNGANLDKRQAVLQAFAIIAG